MKLQNQNELPSIEHRAQRAMAKAFMALRGNDQVKRALKYPPIGQGLATAKPRKVSTDPLQPLINKMTNWQRHQWAKDGYPKSAKKITAILKTERRAA